MAPAQLPSAVAPMTPPTPAVVRAVRTLQHGPQALAARLLAGSDTSHIATGQLDSREVSETLAVWLGVIAGDVEPPDVAQRFEQRGRAHAAHETPPEEAVLLQHATLALLRETLAAELTHDGPSGNAETGDAEAGHADTGETLHHLDDLLRPTLGVATTGIATGYRQARNSPPPDTAQYAVEKLIGHRTRTGGTLHLPRHVTTPLRWCLTTVALPASETQQALRRFRAVNPNALTAGAASRLVCFAQQQPTAPGDFPAHGLAAVDDDTARSAHRAALAAGLADQYGLDRLDVADALPLIGAADQDPDNREEFLTACLGPLHTSDRHRHLLETLRAYLVHGLRTTPAARSLYVHRHTFTYRLHSIRSLTGLDLDHPFHRLRAELALMLLPARSETALRPLADDGATASPTPSRPPFLNCPALRLARRANSPRTSKPWRWPEQP